MTRRLSISDAPEVQLGNPTREQEIPIIETLSSGNKSAGKTTIAKMRAYFSGETIRPTREIARFELDPRRFGSHLSTIGQRPNAFSRSQIMRLRTRADGLIAGTADYFSLIDGEIRLPEAGTYNIKFSIMAMQSLRADTVPIPGAPNETKQFLALIPESNAVAPSITHTEPRLIRAADGSYSLENGTITLNPGLPNSNPPQLNIQVDSLHTPANVVPDVVQFLPLISTFIAGQRTSWYGITQVTNWTAEARRGVFCHESNYLTIAAPTTLRLSVSVINLSAATRPPLPTIWEFTTNAQSTPSLVVIEKI